MLEGRVGALLGDEVAEGGPGDLIFKPRNQWHTFWNAGDTPARMLEIISPAGFERSSRSSSSSEGLLEPHRRTWLRSLQGTGSRSTHRAFPSSSAVLS